MVPEPIVVVPAEPAELPAPIEPLEPMELPDPEDPEDPDDPKEPEDPDDPELPEDPKPLPEEPVEPVDGLVVLDDDPVPEPAALSVVLPQALSARTQATARPATAVDLIFGANIGEFPLERWNA